MTTPRTLLFAALFVLPAAGLAATDEQAAECRAAPTREEPAPRDARERDPRETVRDTQERGNDATDCEAPSWRSRIPGMLR